jgi:hypothetical protein
MGVDYTRFDFLCLCPDDSIRTKSNQEIYTRLHSQHESNLPPTEDLQDIDSVEVSWQECWRKFPNLHGYNNFSDESSKGFEIIVWLIHNFAFLFVMKETRSSYFSLVESCNVADIGWISPDLFAFMYITVQHSINRWRHAFNYIRKMRGETNNEDFGFHDISKDVINKMPGREFEHGKGISGSAGQLRYRSLVKFWYQTYYKGDGSNSEQVKMNVTALVGRLKKLVEEERAKAAEASGGNAEEGDIDGTRKKRKRALPQAGADDMYDDIMNQGWSSLLHNPVVQV